MNLQEQGATHPAMPLGITSLGFSQISEEALLAVEQSRTNNLREKHMQLEGVLPQTGITRTTQTAVPQTI